MGVVGGGERSVRAVTVMTYDSAAMPRRRLNEFGLLIVDEVHHLPAPTYRAIAEKAAAPWRLGLSATPERSDGAHYDLGTLIGPEVYRRRPADLAEEGHIARYREKRIYVDLTPEERARYDLLMAEWRWYLASKRSMLGRGGLFEQLIRQSAQRPGRPAGAPGPAAGPDDRAQRREQDRPGGRAAGPAPYRPGHRLRGARGDRRGGRAAPGAADDHLSDAA